MEKEKIARINALAHKAKTSGLTEAELAERDALRQEYLADIRAAKHRLCWIWAAMCRRSAWWKPCARPVRRWWGFRP